MNTIKIISNGTGLTTKIYNHNGEEIYGVTSIQIDTIRINQTVKARLTFDMAQLEIVANLENETKKDKNNV